MGIGRRHRSEAVTNRAQASIAKIVSGIELSLPNGRVPLPVPYSQETIATIFAPQRHQAETRYPVSYSATTREHVSSRPAERLLPRLCDHTDTSCAGRDARKARLGSDADATEPLDAGHSVKGQEAAMTTTSTTCGACYQTLERAALPTSFARILARFIGTIVAERRLRRDARDLTAMSEHMLKNIGLSRSRSATPCGSAGSTECPSRTPGWGAAGRPAAPPALCATLSRDKSCMQHSGQPLRSALRLRQGLQAQVENHWPVTQCVSARRAHGCAMCCAPSRPSQRSIVGAGWNASGRWWIGSTPCCGLASRRTAASSRSCAVARALWTAWLSACSVSRVRRFPAA